MANGTIAGAGNAGNPFLIEDADDLNAIRNIVKQYPNNAYYYKSAPYIIQHKKRTK